MLDPELEQQVVKLLGQGNRLDEVTVLVCERTGLKWDAAQAEIRRTQERHPDVISRRRRWLIIAAWLPIFFASSLLLLSQIIMLCSDPLRYLTELALHPKWWIVLGSALLIVGGGLYSLFRRRQSSRL